MLQGQIQVGTGANKREVTAPWRVPQNLADVVALCGEGDAAEHYIADCFDRGSRIKAQDSVGRPMRQQGEKVETVLAAMVAYEKARVTTGRVKHVKAPPTFVIREGMTLDDIRAEAARCGAVVVEGK